MQKSVSRDRFERAFRVLHRLKLEGLNDEDAVQITAGTARDLMAILDGMSAQKFELSPYSGSQDELREALAEHGVRLVSAEFARMNGEPLWLVTCQPTAGCVVTVRVAAGPLQNLVSEVLVKLSEGVPRLEGIPKLPSLGEEHITITMPLDTSDLDFRPAEMKR